jgi:Pectate lyase superfamily protein
MMVPLPDADGAADLVLRPNSSTKWLNRVIRCPRKPRSGIPIPACSFESIVPGVMLLLLATFGALVQNTVAQVPIPAEYISVGNYAGTANERITAAIAAAMATDHKTVFFPNGTYALRSGLNLSQGTNTELHFIGESRNGVFVIPDIPYLEANYNGGDWENGGARLAHMINLSSVSVFDSVDVSIQNMTIDMRHQLVMGETTQTYNVVGHGIRVGTGWVTGQFTVNHVTIRNIGGYGVGIQDRDGHPKNNITLTNLLIERTGSDGVDTKEASGDGNRNLVIRDVSINEVGFLDTGAAPALDLRYRDVTIENVNIVSKASHSTLPGQTSSVTGINFRPWDNVGAGIVGATVSNAYIRGCAVGMRIHAVDSTPHANIAISDFRIQGQNGAGIDILGTAHSGHTISDGFVDPAFGGAAVAANGQAVVTNVIAGRWDPALTPLTETTFESNVSLAGTTYSPAWVGMVGSEQVSINPTAPGAGPFVFDVGNTGVMRVDFDTSFNAMDKLIVNGTLNLDGELRISTIGGAPSTAGTYRIFEADAITGSFDSMVLPSVAGLTWVTDNLATDGTISLQQPPNTIIPVNNGSFGGATPIPASYTQSVTVGAGADMLIVMTSSEFGSGGMTVSYGGVPMNLAVGNKANSAIWHLDLSTPGISGTDVVVDLSNSGARNGFAAGWVSIDANLGPDQSIVLHSTGTSASQSNTVDLITTVQTFNVVNFNANNTSKGITVNSPNPTVIYTDTNIGSAEGAAAYAAEVAAGTSTYQWTLAGYPAPASDYRRIDAASFAIVGNDFADWIAGYPGVGGQTGLNDDPDGDGNPNGVEAWFGTNPAESSGGLANLATDGITTTFTHPRSANPPDDMGIVYQWSPNLVDWYACDGVDGPPTGQTVMVSSNTVDTTTTVTATAGEPMACLFLRAAVEQNPSP